MVKKRSAYLAVLIVALFTFAASTHASAAFTVQPDVGQCFMHTRAEVAASFAAKNPISCDQKHNVEIYRVGIWPSETPPWKMSEKKKLETASSVCIPNNDFSVVPDAFNFWAWFTANKKQWAQGERWIRCDGLFITNPKSKQSQWRFRTWTSNQIQIHI